LTGGFGCWVSLNTIFLEGTRMKYLLSLTAVLLFFAPLASAEIRSEKVEYRDGPYVLEGYLAYDDATQVLRPAVLIIPEWWGLTEYPKHRAIQLAGMGYVAFAADMYGQGESTNDPQQATQWATPFFTNRKLMRQRAGVALDTLLNQKYVDRTRVAAIGYCFGGTSVLELARGGSPLAGVICFHGNLARTENEGPDNIKAKILICHGADDPLAPVASIPALIQEMKEAKADYQINIYSGAQHAFTNPDADSHNMQGVAYNAQADKRSWMALSDFFAELFRQQ
jgi:dienelactone hydrolase